MGRGTSNQASGSVLLFGTRQASKLKQVPVATDAMVLAALQAARPQGYLTGKWENTTKDYAENAKWVASGRKISSDQADVDIVFGTRRGKFAAGIVYADDNTRSSLYYENQDLDELIKLINETVHDSYWCADEYDYEALEWANRERENWQIIDKQMILEQIQ